MGTASFSGHVATNGADCASCHARSVSGGYVSWTGGVFTHKATDTNCSSCHNGAAAKGMTTPPHIPVTGIQCSNCHVNTAASFTTYTMSHSAVHATRCDSCHNGSYTGQGKKGAKGPDHKAKSQDCGCCHTGAAVSFSTWDDNPKGSAGTCTTTAKSVTNPITAVRSAMQSVSQPHDDGGHVRDQFGDRQQLEAVQPSPPVLRLRHRARPRTMRRRPSRHWPRVTRKPRVPPRLRAHRRPPPHRLPQARPSPPMTAAASSRPRSDRPPQINRCNRVPGWHRRSSSVCPQPLRRARSRAGSTT